MLSPCMRTAFCLLSSVGIAASKKVMLGETPCGRAVDFAEHVSVDVRRRSKIEESERGDSALLRRKFGRR